MALIDRIAGSSTPRPARRLRFGEIALTLFVALLALTFYAPPLLVAAVGAVLLTAGFVTAGVLWLLRWPTVRGNALLFMFVFWFNFMNVGNFFDYVPIRTFVSDRNA